MNLGGIAQRLVGKVAGIASDSREIKQGYVFTCLSEKAKGFIPDAVKAGAKFIVVKNTDNVATEDLENSEIIVCPEPHSLHSMLSAKFYKDRQPQFIAAVTGTNGKTSVSDFCRQIWSLTGHKAASIGTLGTILGLDTLLHKSSLTTPDPAVLHRTLAELHDKQVEHLCLETSSHGLQQNRINSVKVSAAAFTNLSHDHLDYHGSIEAYFTAKKKLFSDVVQSRGCTVLNADIAEYQILRQVTKSDRIITYGVQGGDVQLLHCASHKQGHNIKIKIFDDVYEGFFPVLGQFQIYNLLCAIALVVSSGSGYKNLPIEHLSAPKGRMEKVCDFIIVDYAHTPNALENSLISLKQHGYSENIVLVFGCGGNRDQTKRHAMGKVANKYASIIVVTDDNPRDEDPKSIRLDILSCCKGAIEIADRRHAIQYAIDLASKKGYIVLIAGKGHESSQLIGDDALPFSDSTVALDCLEQVIPL